MSCQRLAWRLPGTLLWASSSTRPAPAGRRGDRRGPFPAVSSLDTRGCVAAAAARLRGGTRFPPASGSRPPRRAVSRPGATGPGRPAAWRRSCPPRRRAEKDFQAAAPVSGQVGQQRVGACGVGHGSVVLRCSAPRRADDRRRSSADAAILQAPAGLWGNLALQPRQRYVQRQHVDHRRPHQRPLGVAFHQVFHQPQRQPRAVATRSAW